MTRGDVVIERAVAEHLDRRARQADARRGARRGRCPTASAVAMDGRPRCVDVVTLPYPGFPDRPAAHGGRAGRGLDGTALITENVFEARFMFVDELVRLGADVRTDGHHAVVRGRERLSSAPVGPPTSGPAPAWCWPGWSPRASPRCRRPTTSTAVTPTSSSSCAAWAREIERDPTGGLGSAGERDRQRAGAGGVLGEDQHVGAIGAGNGSSTGSRRRRAPRAAPRADSRRDSVAISVSRAVLRGRIRTDSSRP